MSGDEFPFESRHALVDGVRIHYVEAGVGAPVLFVHGNPTWSYLWRNILPTIAETHRAIALDLPGFGRSERPAGARYDFADHARVIDGFIDALGLERLSLVLHDWGGALGMQWAVTHPERVVSVTLMSTFVAPVGGALRLILRLPRLPGVGWLLVQQLNLFVPLVLRVGVVDRSRLTREVMRRYREPFPDAASRFPIRRWTEQLPALADDPTYRVMERIGAALPTFEPPVMIVKATRDPILTMGRARWLAATLPNARLEIVEGAGHFVQEDRPEAVAALLRDFLHGGGASGSDLRGQADARKTTNS